MHLSRLILTNVRQFENRSFEFQPGFNLLVGENGAGKTTILRSLIAVLGGAQQAVRIPRMHDDDIRLRTRHAKVVAEIRTSTGSVQQFSLNKELWKSARRSKRLSGVPLILLYASNEATCLAMKGRRVKQRDGTKRDELRRDEEFLYEMEMEYPSPRVREPGERFGNSRSVRQFVGRVLSTFAADFRHFYWRFEPYDCSIIPSSTAEMKDLAGVEKQAQAHAMRYFAEGWSRRRDRPFQWPDKSKVILEQETTKSSFDRERMPNLKDIWRDMDLSFEAQAFLQTCSLEVKLTPRIMIRRRVGPLSLTQLSDGEQRLFSLFVDIARQLNLQSPDGEIGRGEAIVLIDEIDVHLHPKWQRKIVPALEELFHGCQFVATTHSPFVIQATSRQRITSIDEQIPASFSEEGNSIEDIAENIQGVSVPQRSIRAEILSHAAERYFRLLQMQQIQPNRVKESELLAAEKSYRDATEPFTSDPAVHALLKVQLLEAGDQ